MKGAISTLFRIFIASLLILLVPAAILAEGTQVSNAPPPVAQTLMREGTLATQLAGTLDPDSVRGDEAAAESWLGDKGITPKNGWIADYPVTPNIMGELQETLGNAADSHKIPLSRDEALKRLAGITSELAIVNTAPGDSGSPTAVPDGENQVDPGAVYDYYTTEGPPVVTYYDPPPDYYYLYSWFPYPFWCSGFAFGGFFILNDFHRSVFFDRFHDHGRFHRAFVSNHFRDRGTNRIVRIDPGGRSNVRFTGNSGAFSRQSQVTSGARGTIRSNITSQRTQTPSASMRSGTTSTASFQGVRGRPEGAVTTRQAGGANFSRSFSAPVRSFSSTNSSMSSFRSNGGSGGGFSSRGGGGFSGGGGGYSGGHGGRR